MQLSVPKTLTMMQIPVMLKMTQGTAAAFVSPPSKKRVQPLSSINPVAASQLQAPIPASSWGESLRAPVAASTSTPSPVRMESLALQAKPRDSEALTKEAIVGLLSAIEPARGLLDNLSRDPKVTEVLIAIAGLYFAGQAVSHLKSADVEDRLKQGAMFTQALPKRMLAAAEAFQRQDPPKVPHDVDTILETIRKPEGESRGNEYCNLPTEWPELGQAFEQRIFGNDKKPRIVVDVTEHPDIASPGCPFENVNYVIKHSDRTGQLQVSVVPKSHDVTDNSSWYQDLMRDEVLAEFMMHPETCKPFLVFRTSVGKSDHGIGSSAELMLEKMRKWSGHPVWQGMMENLTKAWLRARLQVFDAHHFHPVESLLEVLEPALKRNPQWEDADILWVNQSGDPDFNTINAVGTIKPILDDLRNTSESDKQKKHDANREKAWQDMVVGAQENMKQFVGEVSLKVGQLANSPAAQPTEQIIAILVAWLDQMMKP